MHQNTAHLQSSSEGRAPAPSTNLRIGETRDVNISGGNFLTVEGNYNYHVNPSNAGIHILFQNIAENSLHDASERYPAPNCSPGTREEVLDILKTWIGDNDTDTPLLWLSGKVGAGKSAIMQALAEELQGADPDKHPIAASFFFGRGKGKRGKGQYLFPTIAYQLALHIPELREPINRIIQSDPSLPTRSMKTQFESLIVDPFRVCRGREQVISPRVVIIDGLDECEDTYNVQQLIIDLVGTAQKNDYFPLRFIFASRPEHQICNAFDKPLVSHQLRRVVLDSFKTSPEIEFLTEKSNDIRDRKAYPVPPASPPCGDPKNAVPLLRACGNTDHFYTTDQAEMQNAVSKLGYIAEGTTGYIFSTHESHTVPLYRMYSGGARDHLYTTNVAERDNATHRYGYTDEGIAGYVYPDSKRGALPLFRLCNGESDHFYTMSALERDVASNKYGYTQEGIAGYIFPF